MKRRRWLLAIGGACLVGPLLTNFYLDHSANVWLQEEIRLAKAAGLAPTSDAYAVGLIPPERNAASKYRIAADLMSKLSDSNRALMTHFEESQAPVDLKARLGPNFKGAYDVAATEIALREWDPILKAIDEAAKMPSVQFLEKPGSYPGISVYTILQLSRGVTQAAASAARAGDYDRALSRLKEAKRMAIQCFDSPDDGNGAGGEILTSAQNTAIRIALASPRGASGDRGFKLMTGFLTERTPAPDLRQTLRIHSFWALFMPDTLASNPATLGLKPDDIDWQVKAAGLVAQRLSMEAQDLHLLREAILALPPRGTDWKREGEVFEKLDRDLDDKSSLYAKYIIARYARVWPQHRFLSGDLEMRHRMAIALCKLLEEQRRTGAYPSALPNLGEVSIDGYSGKPFKYSKASDGFDLYGVGPDRTDNGGKGDDDMCIHVHGGKITFSRKRY